MQLCFYVYYGHPTVFSCRSRLCVTKENEKTSNLGQLLVLLIEPGCPAQIFWHWLLYDMLGFTWSNGKSTQRDANTVRWL